MLQLVCDALAMLAEHVVQLCWQSSMPSSCAAPPTRFVMCLCGMQEQAFQLWKAQQLIRHDSWALVSLARQRKGSCLAAPGPCVPACGGHGCRSGRQLSRRSAAVASPGADAPARMSLPNHWAPAPSLPVRPCSHRPCSWCSCSCQPSPCTGTSSALRVLMTQRMRASCSGRSCKHRPSTCSQVSARARRRR